MRRLRRVAGIMFGYGFKAAPGWMWATLLLTVANGFSAAFYPFGFKVFTDAFVANDSRGMAIGAVLTAGLITLNYCVGNLDANVGFGLLDRMNLFVRTRIAQLVNAVPGVVHFERPDYLQELDLIKMNAGMLSAGPRQTLTALQLVVRSVTMVGLLFSVHPLFVLLPVLTFVPSVTEAASVRIRQRSEERVAERRRLADEFFALSASAGPAKEVRIYGLAPELQRRHDRLAQDVSRSTTRAALLGAVVGSLGWVTFSVGFLGGIAFLLAEAIAGRATPGQVVMAIVLGQQIRIFLAQVATAFGQLFTTARTAGRLLWLEDFAGVCVTEGGKPIPARLTDGIVFDDVRFTYPGTDREVLEGIDLEIPAGAIVAIVGENGAGKTTLVKLLSRMYEPTSGTIRLDGIDISEIDLYEWRSQLAATLQDFVQFELIASETVGVGDLPRLDDIPSIESALDRASAGDVVDSLDAGLETQLGRSFLGGRELSGGQWQKLALGRGMMRDRPLLLILDEPTASLDAETEHQLFERYAAAARRTREESGGVTILVSHRFSTVRVADMIVVLDGGRIVEHGSHAELMRKAGMYAELFDLQARAYR